MSRISQRRSRKLTIGICCCSVICSFVFAVRTHDANHLTFAGSTALWKMHLDGDNSEPDYCTSKQPEAVTWVQKLYDDVRGKMGTTCINVVRIGGSGDGGKFMCLDGTSRKNCIVYSLGSRLDFSFEESLLEVLDCEVFTFDCTVGNPGHVSVNQKIKFFPWCVGGESGMKPISSDLGHGGEIQQYYTLDDIMHKLGHARVDLLKMDIERHEIDVFSSFSTQNAPRQILFETHLHNAYGMWGRPMLPTEWESMWRNLKRLGYKVFSHEPNPMCLCCSEWSAMNTRSAWRVFG